MVPLLTESSLFSALDKSQLLTTTTDLIKLLSENPGIPSSLARDLTTKSLRELDLGSAEVNLEHSRRYTSMDDIWKHTTICPVETLLPEKALLFSSICSLLWFSYELELPASELENTIRRLTDVASMATPDTTRRISLPFITIMIQSIPERPQAEDMILALRPLCLTIISDFVAYCLPAEPQLHQELNRSVSCDCGKCQILNEFLSDSTRAVWNFRPEQLKPSEREPKGKGAKGRAARERAAKVQAGQESVLHYQFSLKALKAEKQIWTSVIETCSPRGLQITKLDPAAVEHRQWRKGCVVMKRELEKIGPPLKSVLGEHYTKLMDLKPIPMSVIENPRTSVAIAPEPNSPVTPEKHKSMVMDLTGSPEALNLDLSGFTDSDPEDEFYVPSSQPIMSDQSPVELSVAQRSSSANPTMATRTASTPKPRRPLGVVDGNANYSTPKRKPRWETSGEKRRCVKRQPKSVPLPPSFAALCANRKQPSIQ